MLQDFVGQPRWHAQASAFRREGAKHSHDGQKEVMIPS